MAIDRRFYASQTGMTLGAIAQALGLDPRNYPDREITGISSFQAASPNDLCFFESQEFPAEANTQWAQGGCLVSVSLAAQYPHLPQLLGVEEPKARFFALANGLVVPKETGDNSGAATVHDSASVGANCVIGEGAVIGPRTRIGANSVIGPGVQIGADCQIGAHVSLSFSLIGNGVRLSSGARLGESGFGLMTDEEGPKDIPHFGRVIIQDAVTIGANSCVDRGMLGDTVIGEGSKIDNLCHIGHNTHIGRQVVMAAFAGISGSVTIGDNVQMGGRVGLIDHLTVGENAQIAAGSAVLNSVPADEVWAGMPAKPIKTWQRELVWVKRNAKREGET